MGTCKTCAHWRRETSELHLRVHPRMPLEDWIAGAEAKHDEPLHLVVHRVSPYGTCLLSDEAYAFAKPTPTAPMIYSDDDGFCKMNTRAGFGCNVYEAAG